MKRDDLQARQSATAQSWAVEDEVEQTFPRFALGTREVVPLSVAPEPFHRDLAYEEVAQIVHDFKGPLGTIALEVELLAEDTAAATPVETMTIVDRIMRNVAFLDRMVMDLLDRCTLEAGRLELRLIPTDLRALLEHVVARVVPTRERHRVVLDASELAIVVIDDLRIERVIANLLHNALEYGPPGAAVTVKLERRPDLVRVSVTDAGEQLTERELASIFDEHRRSRPASSRKGTGIGLFLSKQIIEAHGATMGVDIIRGEGTRFYFELPTTS